MFKNYLKFIFRNLAKKKIFSYFSLTSMCFGLLCALLVYLYINHELSYDTFFDNANRIVRLEYESSFNTGPTSRYAILPGQYLPSQLQSIPEITEKTRLVELPDIFVELEKNNKIPEKNAFSADSSFFKIFNFKIVYGDNHEPLAKPNGIVLTRKTATRYFGQENPVGKKLSISYEQREVTLIVSAVMENIPSNSHLDFNFIVSENLYESLFNSDFSQSYVGYEYLMLNSEVNKAKVVNLEDKIDDLHRESNQDDDISINYRLMPLTSIHLYSSSRGEITPNSDIRYIYFFGIMALVILAISSINFISLFLSESINRYKDIEIRKVLGAHTNQLISQILLEAVIICTLSFLGAYLISYLVLPVLSSLTGMAFNTEVLLSLSLFSKGLLFAVFIGLVSGIYPSLFISSNRFTSLSHKFSGSTSGKAIFQNSIVLIQFIASCVLITGTLLVDHQLSFIQNKDLGFETNNIITTRNSLGKELNLFKNKLSNNSNVEYITASSYIPGTSENSGTALVEALDTDNKVTCNWVSVDYNFFKAYDIEVLDGRTFSKEFSTDSTNSFMLNQAAVKALELKNPLGKQINAFGHDGKIIGVIKDFNFLSLHRQIPPMIFFTNDDYFVSISVKIAEDSQFKSVIKNMEKIWYTLQPNTPFEVTFLQNKIDELYLSERNVGKSFFIFALIAIFISCLGLFSLAAYSMRKKTKEIGIRKVLGATVVSILSMFYIKYFRLVLVANIIAIPLAYVFINKWLDNFAYRINIGLLPFILSFIATCIFAALAVSYWTLKAAYSNPIDSIQTE